MLIWIALAAGAAAAASALCTDITSCFRHG